MTELRPADWLPLVLPVLVAVAVLVLPGLAVIAATTRLRPWLVAVAPAVSVGLVTVSAILWGFLGFSWNLGAVAVMTLVVAAVAYLLRRVLRADGGEPPASRAQWLWPAGGLVVGGLILAAQTVRAIGAPDNVSQTFDAMFHLNAVQHILESGNGSAFGLVDFTGNTFYPLGWHDVVALVAQLTGLGVPEATTAVNVAVAALVWPAGAAALAAVMLPERAWTGAVAAVVSGAFAAFPFRLLEFGVLYSNFLSFALLPACLALVVRVLGLPFSAPRTTRGEHTVRVLLLLVGASGLALAQPNGLMSLLIMSVPLLLWSATVRVRRLLGQGRRRAAVWVGALALVAVALLAVVWDVVRPPEEAAGWPRYHWGGQALGLALTVSPWSGITAWVVLLLMGAGVAVLCRRPERLWVAGPYAVATLLYVVASSRPVESELRLYLTGVYLNDTQRLAALLPIGAVVVCTLGAVALLDGTLALMRRVRPGLDPRLSQAGALVLGVLLVVGVATSASTDEGVHNTRGTYEPGALLTADERALLERLPELTPPDSVIAGNPLTGASLAYALGERRVTEVHGFTEVPREVLYLDANLDRIDDDPRVCRAVDQADVDYVLDFGTDLVLGWSPAGIDYSGYEDLRPGNHLELVDREGKAALYRIVGC
ncbi:hypothetical protein DNL40_05450 [Xylanimonas oleitrophica]|uniref:Uncharacterized protein n=1 Tax=Xylanimonas oleitrophica TaxID=2607479 RepID=A0A2W5WU29_9MICO|nr:DUF6541 family protein [Xylanimonas oleitrophica]PZR54342.1 hypothetical protein DNL40_05450 [Xylanimonas oleitrophica]